MLEGSTFTSNLINGGDNSGLDFVTAYLTDVDNITEDGELFVVQFMINENVNAGEELSVQLSYGEDDLCNQYLNNVTADITQGTINIANALEMEADGDNNWIYIINNITISNTDGTTREEFAPNGDFDLEMEFEGADEDAAPQGILIAATYDANSALVSLNTENITEDMINVGKGKLHIDETINEISSIKVFIWDSLAGMRPLAESYVIQEQDE